jgi:hypothetical protein
MEMVGFMGIDGMDLDTILLWMIILSSQVMTKAPCNSNQIWDVQMNREHTWPWFKLLTTMAVVLPKMVFVLVETVSVVLTGVIVAVEVLVSTA